MAFKRGRARVGESSSTSGSGPWTLAGKFDSSHQDFTFLSNGDTIEVTVKEPGVAVWTGLATYGVSGPTRTITPTTVEETFGTFGSATKEITADFLASRALLREDMAGAITTGGTSSAYTVSSFTGYATLAKLDGKLIAFTMHTTNAQGGVTLAVDGLAAKPLRMVPSTDLLPGVLIQGTPYMALYNNSDGAFYLHGFHGDPLGIPLSFTINGYASVVPNSCFAIPNGQAINRTIFAPLFSLIGTTYGSGNGTTTFNIPDETGCVEAMQEASATRLTSNGWSGNSTVIGSRSGVDSRALTLGQLPVGINSRNATQSISVTSANNVLQKVGAPTTAGNGGAAAGPVYATSTDAVLISSGSNDVNVSSNNTLGNVSPIVQPTIIKFRAMRVL